ncbi:MAG: hypothetical protein R3E98_12050 [Gemmatimonadota bacterium]|nr:hypothetical protein [Gemmatimonadota bacterium]
MVSPPVRSLALALAALGTGCYTYRPVELAEVRPNTEIRARVSAQEAARLAEVLGGRERRELDGRVVEAGAEGVTLDVAVVSSVERGGDALRQRLELTPDRILEVEVRELSQSRTGALLGIALGGGVALLVSQLHGGAGERPPGIPPPSEMRIPFRIPIPW